MENFKKSNILYFFLLLIVLLFGLWIRFDNISFWKKNRSLFYFNNLPIYSAYDSFHFAKLSQDIKKGMFKLGEPEYLRMFPDNKNPEIAPKYELWGNLISFVEAYLSKLFNLPIEKITFYLIPILAVLFVIPLFFYFKDLGYPFSGLIGGIIGVSASMYLGRTSFMRLDTDCLNLFFPFFIAYAFLQFFSNKNPVKKYLWIIVASLGLFLYKFWYSVDGLMFLLVSVFVFYLFIEIAIKKKKRNLKDGLIGLAILIIPNIWFLINGPLEICHAFSSLVLGLKKTTAEFSLYKDFPNIMQSISELQHASFNEILGRLTSYSLLIGVLGFLGAILFFLLNFRKGLFILPFFGIGILSFFSGSRFAMYLAPFIGIGLGYWLHLFIEKIFPRLGIFNTPEKQKIVLNLTGVLFFITTLAVQSRALTFHSYPKVLSPIVKNMVYLKTHTPSNAAIWTWWDYGYAFEYYSRRATFHDGGAQTTPKTYFIARSFATPSFKEAWNITAFLSHYGLTGIKKFLQNGTSAKELVEMVREGKLSPSLSTPVYWVFTQDLFTKFGWIYYFGTYDFNKKRGTFGKFFFPKMCKAIPEGLICQGLGKVNLISGVIDTGNGVIPIMSYFHQEGDKKIEKNFFKKGVLFVWIEKPKIGNFVAVYPEDVAQSTFVKMFVLRKYDKKYFTLVRDDFPFAVIYKVNSKP